MPDRRTVRRPIAWLGLVACLVLWAGVLSAPARAATPRVAALTPFSANTLAYLGVRPVVIGQTVGQAQYSSRLGGVPVLRLSHPFGPNLEQLAQRNPRLVLTAPAWARGRRDDAIAEWAQRYADRLAEWCLLAPQQWFNFYPYWNVADA